MDLGRVAGQVVSTVRLPGMPHNSLLLVDMMDREGNPTLARLVAVDPIGAGTGEWVLITRGGSARSAFPEEAPVDAVIIGIVDHVADEHGDLYRKNQG